MIIVKSFFRNHEMSNVQGMGIDPVGDAKSLPSRHSHCIEGGGGSTRNRPNYNIKHSKPSSFWCTSSTESHLKKPQCDHKLLKFNIYFPKVLFMYTKWGIPFITLRNLLKCPHTHSCMAAGLQKSLLSSIPKSPQKNTNKKHLSLNQP